MTDIYKRVEELCRASKAAAPSVAHADTKTKNLAIAYMAEELRNDAQEIIGANKKDLASAADNGVAPTMLDRLKLDRGRIENICLALEELIKLPDPIGKGQCFTRPSGIEIQAVRAPLGVVGIIYEARPNVTVDAAALCLKSGNAAVLRGGKEAIYSNLATTASMRRAVARAGLNPDIIGLVDITDREGATALMSMRGYIDVLIPRGGRGLIRSVVENARVPVIETGAGNCHLYVDESADIRKAITVAVNAKCQRPSVCNAIETLLVHKNVAEKFLPAFAEAVKDAGYNVEYRSDTFCKKYLPEGTGDATEEDYYTEYNDYILAVKSVDSADAAIAHINKYGTGHSDAIMTQSLPEAEKFRKNVDSAAVYVNASTRFTDGGEFGFGAEIGISTQKLHARGPMGLDALTTQKYLITGDGTVRK